MLDWTRRMPAAGAMTIALTARELGLDPDPLLERAELPPLHQLTAEASITGLQEVALLRALQASAPGRRDLGLLDIPAVPLTYGGILGFIFEAAGSFEEALQRNLHYLPLTWAMMKFSLPTDEDHLNITFHPGDLPDDAVEYYVLRNARVAVAWLRRQGYSDPVQAEFALPAPADPRQRQVHADVFGALPIFDAPESVVRVPLGLAREPLTSTTATLFEGLREEADRQLSQYLAGDSVVTRVRTLLRTSLPDNSTLEDAAAAFYVAPRTLRRQLATEGTSFRTVLDSVRADLADEWLRGPNLQINQMAGQLGYSRPPAFNAAFQRWFGCSPREYRDRLRQGALEPVAGDH